MSTPGLKILVTRLSHIGDCVLTLPMVCAIRDHLPNAHITWVVEKPTNQLLEGHDAIDELVVVPRGFLKQPRAVFALRRRLRELEIDVSIDPQSLTKSSIISFLGGVPRRLGLARPLGRELAPILNTELVSPGRPHLVDRSLDLLNALGIDSPGVRFSLPKNTAADATIEQFLRSAHLGCDFAVINPGAGWPSKQWQPKKFGAIARYLGQNYQVPTVVAWAGAAELQMAELIEQRSGGHAMLAPRTTLCELVSLFKRSLFYIGGDTGPMHMAAAVDTPCLGLFGPTLPENCGPYGLDGPTVGNTDGPHTTVQAFYQDTERKTNDAAMKAIEVDMVTAACDEMLQRLGKLRTRSSQQQGSRAA